MVLQIRVEPGQLVVCDNNSSVKDIDVRRFQTRNK